MQTAVTGFPRIGKNRELKFATESYFKGKITEEELRKKAAEIRSEDWKLQKEAGISLISVGDFSFYDQVLDTAELLNVVPKRFRDLSLSKLDTYFAMARGYQGDQGNATALAMKKWFNTNYHYLVPEFEDDTEVVLDDEGVVSAVEAAKQEGIGENIKVSLIGPFTFLKLSRFTGEKQLADFKTAVRKEYFKLLSKLDLLVVPWVQFEEPYLVRDLDQADIDLFKELYQCILTAGTNTKVLLETYFGDVRDVYDTIFALDFDGVGLDFLEGRRTEDLVLDHGVPEGKILFAGLVNGKNIWRNHYADTLKVLDRLESSGQVKREQIVLSTSCSLLHVPYTTAAEENLPEDVKKHFAFAVEKLDELAELGRLADLDEAAVKADPDYQASEKLYSEPRKDAVNSDVQERVADIPESAYTREPAFAEREKIQKARFNLPKYPTTTIGSFPQTRDVRENRKKYKKGEITKEQYIEFNKQKIRECIELQEKLGLDVLVHGEFERNDMVEYFGDHLEGFVFTDKAWVQSYGTRCVKPPVIWGDVSRREPITVFWSVYAQSLTKKPVKGMLTGPVTILNWSFPREDISHKESTLQIALAIRDEVLDLERNGISIIQIDEAALREKLPLRKSDWYSQYLDWAIPAFRLVASGVKAETQIHTHMCYSEFTDIIPAIDAMDADVITFEASRSDLQILDSLQANHFKTEVGPGVYDIHSPRVPSEEEILTSLRKMKQKVNPDKLWVNPDCGLKTRDVPETIASLTNLVAAAKELRKEG